MGGIRIFARLTSVLFVGGLLLEAGAQVNNSSSQANALMQLMLSQPPVDIDSAVVVQAVCDPPVVGVGETAIYRLTLNGMEASIRWPEQIRVPPGLKMTPGAHGQMLTSLGAVLRPLTALNFHVSAERPGFYKIPGFQLEVSGKRVGVPETMLEVAELLEPGHALARQIYLTPSRTNVYVGEPLRLRMVVPSAISNLIENLTQVEVNGDGFADDKSYPSQQAQTLAVKGRMTTANVLEKSVTPIAPGLHQLSAQAFTSGFHTIGPVVFSGQFLGNQQMLLDSTPVAIEVRPLPPLGDFKGFTGFIGNLSLDAQRLSTNALRVGDAIRLQVAFRGSANLSRLVPPPAPEVAGWQIFPPAPADVISRPTVTMESQAAFSYTLIPMTEEVRQTPLIPFSVFNPERGTFVDLSIRPMAITVTAEGLPADWKATVLSGDEKREAKPALSKVAELPGRSWGGLVPVQLRGWFLPAQALPGLVFFGLWWWERRRAFLAAHPELVRRRQARRALRREKRALRRAVASGDAPGFVAGAVSALRVAAAPHFPAEPRALVCGEVLSLFKESERRGKVGETIRSFFTREETVSYAPRHAEAMPLFALQPELEGILNQLEERL